jgi:hypothetical protein
MEEAEEKPVGELQPGAAKEGPQPGGTNVTPNEQEAYEIFMAQVGNVLYDPKTIPKLLQRLNSGGPKADAIAQTAMAIVMRVQDSAEESGRRVDPDILLSAGKETVEMIGEICDKAGLEVTTDELEQAYLLGVDQYRATRQQQGKLAPEAFQQDMNFLKQADAEGRIDEVVPGLSSYADKAKQRAPAGEPRVDMTEGEEPEGDEGED